MESLPPVREFSSVTTHDQLPPNREKWIPRISNRKMFFYFITLVGGRKVFSLPGNSSANESLSQLS